MSEVVPIRAGISPVPTAGIVNDEVVKELQNLLDKAKAGEVMGFAYASLHPGDLTTYGNFGCITRGVIGALMLLQYSMAKTDAES